MPPFRDLTGKRFSRLLVIKLSTEQRRHRPAWECRCACGKTIILSGNALQSGNTQSCGCWAIERAKEKFTIHGYSRSPNKQKRKTHNAWSSLQNRCLNPYDRGYKNYGGRGITVCKRWLGKKGFINFLSDMGEAPLHLSLDRIDNNKGYSPKNCRWTDRKTQRNNQRQGEKGMIRLISIGKQTLCLLDWCKEFEIKERGVYKNMHLKGWDPKLALLFAKTKKERNIMRSLQPYKG